MIKHAIRGAATRMAAARAKPPGLPSLMSFRGPPPATPVTVTGSLPTRGAPLMASGPRSGIKGGHGSLLNTAIGAGMGSMGGAVMADEDRRWTGAIGGGVAGIAGGAMMGRYARKGFNNSWNMASSQAARNNLWAANPRAPQAFSSNVQGINQSMNNMVAGFHKKENRNAVFRSGALLGGSAFGYMFAGNNKSHKSGFNANRGNGISR